MSMQKEKQQLQQQQQQQQRVRPQQHQLHCQLQYTQAAAATQATTHQLLAVLMLATALQTPVCQLRHTFQKHVVGVDLQHAALMAGR
jgi:hypothetical protein